MYRPNAFREDDNEYGRTEILHHSQLAVGAGSPTALKLANRFYKPALPHEKSSY
jgi:hypothetical protein